jgi:radical SAM protein with 4Fe4S-binding SPASM domain
MKRFNKIYLEISNVCNLSCAFCPGTKRVKHIMTEDEFTALMPRLRPWSDYLYFHIMGEPLLHPNLARFLEIAGEFDFKVILTTNGTLLKKQQETLLASPALHKVNISLHAFEANDLAVSFEEYLRDCFRFGKAAEGNKLVVYRLWNNGGADALNRQILQTIESHFPEPWTDNRQGKRIGERIFLEYGDKFDWPDLSAPEASDRVFCYGLRDQIGVLCDGTVVPCCLDHEGDIALGNLFDEEMDTILATPRAQSIYSGFTKKEAAEELCRKCGYARRLK